MKGILWMNFFLLFRLVKCEEPEFYDILNDSIELVDNSNITDGMDGFSAQQLTADNPITIPIDELKIGDKFLLSPFIINTVFKLETDESSCLFKITVNETTKLGVCFMRSSQTLTRVHVYSDAFEEVAILLNFELENRWTKLLFFIEEDSILIRVNCSESNVKKAKLEKMEKDVFISSGAILSLGHSSTGKPYPFQGAIQEIKIYPNADSERLQTICFNGIPDIGSSESVSDDEDYGCPKPENLKEFTDAPPVPGEKGEKGDKGDSLVGPSGPQGPIGPVGPQGLKGEKGTCECTATSISEIVKRMPELKGPPGADGAPGIEGPQGLKGDRGIKGDKGDRGDDGVPGLRGDPGINGNPGPIGPPGPDCKDTKLKAKTGQRGEPGIPGNNGVNGSKGAKGEQGSPGPAGRPGNITMLLDSDFNPNHLKAIAKKLKTFCEPEDKESKNKIALTGPPGLKGQKGDRGPKGDSHSRGAKRTKTTLSKAELIKLKGEKGDRGETGPQGPIGPSIIVNATGSQGPPGPPGLPGPRGHPGASIIGPKGEPGNTIVSSIYEEKTANANHEDYVYVTETVVFKTTTALFKRTENTPMGTLAFVRQNKKLVLRVDEGWQHVMLGSLLEEDNFITLPNKEENKFTSKRALLKVPSTSKRPVNLDNGYIRIAALNTPYSGNILHHFNEDKFTNSECQPQALQAGLRDGPFVPFLAEREPHNFLRWRVMRTRQKYPVVNLKKEILFDSFESMFNGSGAALAVDHPPIYSFDGRNVYTHPDWPIKAVWHGSDTYGYHLSGIDCDSFQSNSSNVFGMAAPLVRNKLLGQEWYPCNKRLIVLCVDFTPKQRKRRHSRRKSIYRYDVNEKNRLSNVTNT